MTLRTRLPLACAVVLLAASACRDTTTAPSAPQLTNLSPSLQENQGVGEVLRGAVIHQPLGVGNANGNAGNGNGNPNRPPASNNLTYGGGSIQNAPKIYLVVWGSQWNNNDPSGEAGILESFYAGIGGSSWLKSVTQYCQGVAKGTTFCNGGGTAAEGTAAVYGGVWVDNAHAAPSRPSQSDIAAEALSAATHFGNGAAANANAQYVIATATGNNSTGFKTQYCAYHSSTSSTAAGNVSYTNLPYITDAGASCGAGFNGLSAKAGITIVSGHEAAESITDPYPNSGWLDQQGAENGDKCAWIATGGQGASTTITISTGTFAIQSLWSNVANSNAGGCAVSYP